MKICLKCKRNLFDKDNQCDKCGCADIMDKKEYDILCSKFESATNKEKEQLRKSEEYSIICKYKFIIDTNNTPEKRKEQSEHDKKRYKQEMEQYRRELAMKQKQSEQVKNEKEQNTPKCPTCGSTNVEPISTGRKAIELFALGLTSKTVGKSYRCKNCKYYW